MIELPKFENIRPKLASAIESIRPQLDKVSGFMRSKVRLLSVVIVLFAISIFLGVSVGNAGPGDFFFFPKLVLENRFLSINPENPEASTENILQILADRGGHLKYRISIGDCTSVSIAAAEFDYQLGRAFDLMPHVSGQNTSKIMVGVHETLSSIEANSVCELPVDLLAIQYLSGAIAVKFDTNALQSSIQRINSDTNLELEQSLDRESDSELLDQQRLDGINALVQLNREVMNQEDIESNSYMDAVQARLAVLNVNILLDSESPKILNWDQYSDALCRYFSDECIALDLDAKWNSINYSGISARWDNSLESGRVVFEEVLDNLFSHDN